ncbi:hypothetical protein DFH08DRAFT_840162 [Mycena albidolilacea]|uniref:Uncharacterized protein n=1 Tax=Mycena albidolilacea TaxID=1033008 RepID=A0AAD7AQ86_9AGAR|nr:hypothetical protein DFH08DRAFT_840162 [Mycena albidolilacea]
MTTTTTATPFSMFFLLLCLPSLALLPPAVSGLNIDARRSPSISNSNSYSWPRRRTSNVARSEPALGYYVPADAGGAMLTKAPGTSPPAGEPLNVIIAGTSDAAVLVDSQDKGGFRNFFLSVGFAGECLGQHEGAPQTADLGDGNGYKNETAVLRWDYGDPSLGTCQETIQGGNHFRYWVQSGTSGAATGGASGAYFLATSYEKPIALGHDIIVDGYNQGRDWLIGNITKSAIPTATLTNTSTFTGTTSFGGYTYSSSISYVSGLLANSSVGVNHADTVGVNGANPVDGLVAVVEVKITGRPAGESANSASRFAGTRGQGALIPTLLLFLLGALCL